MRKWYTFFLMVGKQCEHSLNRLKAVSAYMRKMDHCRHRFFFKKTAIYGSSLTRNMVPITGWASSFIVLLELSKLERRGGGGGGGGQNNNNRPINLSKVITFSTDYKYTSSNPNLYHNINTIVIYMHICDPIKEKRPNRRFGQNWLFSRKGIY